MMLNYLPGRRSRVRVSSPAYSSPHSQSQKQRTGSPPPKHAYTISYTKNRRKLKYALLFLIISFLTYPTPLPAHNANNVDHLRFHLTKKQGELRIVKQANKRLRQQSQPAPIGLTQWLRLASCESGGRWSLNNGNGYYGGLQFHPETWRAYGGRTFAASANKATPIQQVAVAQKVLAGQGRGAWPGCTNRGAW